MRKIVMIVSFTIVGLFAVSYIWHSARRSTAPPVPITEDRSEIANARRLSEKPLGTLHDDAFLDRIFWEAEAAVESTRWEESLRNPKTFLRIAHLRELNYEEVRTHLSHESLPELYTVLRDESHADDWRYAAQLIAYISPREDQKAIAVLTEYLQRTDDWSRIGDNRQLAHKIVLGKVMTLEWIGMIGGDTAESVLTRALSLEGAEAIASQWIDELPDSYPGGRSQILASIRGRAAIGLAFSQEFEHTALIENAYMQELVKVRENGGELSPLFLELVSAMAQVDLIREVGLIGRFELYGRRPEYLNSLKPFVHKHLDAVHDERDSRK